MTSHDAVFRIRRMFHERAGHAGTLDPDATGVLVIAVGRARHLLSWIDWEPKIYEGTMGTGVLTSTLDRAGTVVGRSMPPWPSAEDWARAGRLLVGKRMQMPPRVSAKKIGGRRSYQAVREGLPVWPSPALVEVRELRVRHIAGREVTFQMTVGSGTYVRALVRDWAESLGHAAHLVALTRTAVGAFTLAESVSLEDVAPDPGRLVPWRAVWPEARIRPVAASSVPGLESGRLPKELERDLGPYPLAVSDGDRLYAVLKSPGKFARVFPGGLEG